MPRLPSPCGGHTRGSAHRTYPTVTLPALLQQTSAPGHLRAVCTETHCNDTSEARSEPCRGEAGTCGCEVPWLAPANRHSQRRCGRGASIIWYPGIWYFADGGTCGSSCDSCESGASSRTGRCKGADPAPPLAGVCWGVQMLSALHRDAVSTQGHPRPQASLLDRHFLQCATNARIASILDSNDALQALLHVDVLLHRSPCARPRA